MSQHSEQATISDLEEIEGPRTFPGTPRQGMVSPYQEETAVVCVAVLAIVYLVGIFAPVLAPYKYTDQDYKALKAAPKREPQGRHRPQGSGHSHPNHVGHTEHHRHHLRRHGNRGLVIGVTLGLISGYFGRRVDSHNARWRGVLIFPRHIADDTAGRHNRPQGQGLRAVARRPPSWTGWCPRIATTSSSRSR